MTSTDEHGGAISDETGSLGPATQAISSQPAPDAAWLLGNRYRVVDRIGVGGMADVFRAHDELLARDVAVKVFRNNAVEADTASGVERQQIELHALARLNHPNLITLFDGSLSGGDEGPTFLVMELINGPTLAARIAEGPLAEPEVREVGIQIADALAYVHAEGMVHRDVKPANILLGTDRTAGDMTVRARLSDFGIVRLLGSERMTSVDFTVGTASYLAPEQARGSDVGPVADVYSLGLVLLEAHTGVRAYEGTPVEAVLARLERGPEIPDHLPPPWPALLAAMTATDPDHRPDAEQVAQILRDSTTRTAPFSLAAAAGAGLGATAATSTAAANESTGVIGAAGAAGAAALAGVAAGAAGTAGAAALADAPTVGIAALGGSGAVPAPPVHDPWAPADEPRRRRGALWLMAAVLLAALAVGGVLLFRPTSSNNPPADQKVGPTTSHSPAVPRSSTIASVPQSSASSTAPTTSAPPSSSTVPSSSAPASTSATPSTSATATSTGTPTTTTSTSTSSGAVASTAAVSSSATSPPGP
jgi:serine/threonine protein kinase